VGVFDDHSRPTNQYSAGQYLDALELRQRRLSRTQHGNYANDNGPASHSEPVTLTTVTFEVVHQTALRVLLRLTLHQMYQTKSFIGITA
jgi:hypothetical protein